MSTHEQPSNGSGTAVTVKEMVLDLSEKMDEFMAEHRRQHEELREQWSEHQLASQLTDIEVAKVSVLESRVALLEQDRIKKDTTISTLKWVFGGSSLIGVAVGMIGLWAALGGI